MWDINSHGFILFFIKSTTIFLTGSMKFVVTAQFTTMMLFFFVQKATINFKTQIHDVILIYYQIVLYNNLI